MRVRRSDPTDGLRIATASGAWRSVEASTFGHTDDPDTRGFLITGKLIDDRSDVGRSIELLGTGAPVGEVLPLIARLGDRVMGTTLRCALAWRHDDDVMLTWSPDAPMPDPRLAETARRILRSRGGARRDAHRSLPPAAPRGRGVAAELGYLAANIVPIVASYGDEVIGCLLGWGHHPVELSLHLPLPLHVGLRIASLGNMVRRLCSAVLPRAGTKP